jgi:RimJ/RimL family protein N-acetyltransferase
MLPAYQGRKYTTHAGKLVLSFADSNWPDDKPFYIEATVHPQNAASASVLTKLGFTPDSERLSIPKYGSVRDYYVLTSI